MPEMVVKRGKSPGPGGAPLLPRGASARDYPRTVTIRNGYRRDAVTATGFGLIGVWAFFVYLVGPISGAARDGFGLTDGQVGLIGTALAAGLLGSALVGPALVGRLGRRTALLSMLVVMAGSAMVIATASGFPAMLLGVLAAGLAGAVVANTATAVLSDHHPAHRGRAITEANAAAAWLGLVAPLVVAAFLPSVLGWQGAPWMLALQPVCALPAVVRGLPRPAIGPTGHDARPAPGRPLPGSFRVGLICVAMAVAAEFSVNFWAVPLIAESTGATLGSATAALSGTVLGVAIGRTFAARLPDRFPLARLIVAAFAVLVVGMTGLLLAQSYPVAVLALLVIGLGLSVLFPFAQAMTLALVPRQADRGVAMISLAIGAAIGTAPFLLGLLAGAAGLRSAFLAVFAMAATGIAAALAVGRTADRR
jgi:MFS family permease